MKKIRIRGRGEPSVWNNFFRLMKLTTLFLLIGIMQLSASVYSQTTKLTIDMRNSRVVDVLEAIEKQSEFRFAYSSELIDMERRVSVDLNRKSIDEILSALFRGTNVKYVLYDRHIMLYPKEMDVVKSDVRNIISDFQKRTISGKVTDVNNQPLPGVTVIVKGTTNGTVTNVDGEYMLTNIPPDGVLQFSFVGMRSQEIAVVGKTEINVKMIEETIGLEEVVAVGYGTQSKKKVTSSVSEVDMTGLRETPAAMSGQALQGRVPGVVVQDINGAPGASPAILIQGISSINAGISPLVVIDGFPMEGGMPASLNPSDIESISVLKDAAATSIYGARGSNGVIIIQTIKAEKSQMEIEYNVSHGFQYLPKSWRPKMLNALEYAQYNKERIEELNVFNGTSNDIPEVFLNVVNNPDDYSDGGTDWLSALAQQGASSPVQNHNITIRAGNERLRGSVSAGYFNQAGILPDSKFKRYSFRTNIESTLTEWLKMGANLSVSHTDNNTIAVGGSRGILMSAITGSPLSTPYDENGDIIPYIAADASGYFSYPNPIYKANNVDYSNIGRDVNASFNLDVEIIPGLHYKPQVYAQLFSSRYSAFTPTTIGTWTTGISGNLSRGEGPYVNSATFNDYDLINWGLDNLLTYDKTLNDHSFSAMVGYTAQEESGEVISISATDFPTDNILNYLEASEVSTSVSDYSNWSLAAFFARLRYDYKAKYLAEINFRREGSSRFGKNNKYGNFPSASIGWRVSQEDFFPKNFIVNELKLTASYGITGNSAIDDFDIYGSVVSIPSASNVSNNYNYVLNDGTVVGKALTSLGNQDLKWETSHQLNIGLQAGLLHDRITFSMNYYKKTTKDMLFDVTVPEASGFSSTRDNVGEMVNHGLDFGISSGITSGTFSWNSNLSLSFMKNEVTYIPDEISRITSTYNVTQEGSPVGALYGYVVKGIFYTQEQVDDPDLIGKSTELGCYIFQDTNGDGTIADTDKDVIGNPHPRFTFGFNNTFSYKHLSLSVLTTGAFGYKIYQALNEVYYNEKARWNVSKNVLHRWKSAEDPGDGLLTAVYDTGGHAQNNYWLESGNHVWIKNITLAYDIPASVLNRTKFISTLRIYLSAQNALKITNYSGFNPQISYYGGSNAQTFGLDNFSYPISRTISLGANIKF